MNARRTRWFDVAMLGWIALLGFPAFAQVARFSPFDPDPFRRQPTAMRDEPIEYLGFIQTAEGTQFRVRDRVLQRAAFVRLNESDPDLGITVRGYDEERRILTLQHGGRMLNLSEPKPRVRPAPAPRSGGVRPPAALVPAVSPAIMATVVPNPTPQQERERLDAIRAEIIRRQEERAKAARP